jgi:SNF2 family DNA or RNA helicase
MGKHFTPHDDQWEAMDHIFANPRCALWMRMGGGKTVSTLTALESLSTIRQVYPALVVAPKRVARSTWPEELAKWSHLNHLRVSVVMGTAKEREAALRIPADIYTTNYDNLDWLVSHLGAAWPFVTVVADELTRLKSFRTRQGGKRAGALGKVAHTRVERFIGLTGTPAPNGLKDLWGQTWFLDKGERLGSSYSAFEQRWFRKGFDGFSIEAFPHSQAEIESKLADICLTVQGAAVDETVVSPVYVDLDRKSRELYRSMEKLFFAELAEIGVEAHNAAVRANKLRQIASGILIDEDSNWHAVHGLKLEALESIVEEANGMPVLVQYDFIADKERILKHFKQARFLDDDPKTIKRWNAGGIGMLLAHGASAGHGLNLQDGGNILARFGFDWNLEYYMQILERIGPMRQKQSGYDRPVYDYPILARGTIDEVVFERHATKRSVQELLLAAMERHKESHADILAA